jgi:hypothetical protein
MRKYATTAELNEAWELIIRNIYPAEEVADAS